MIASYEFRLYPNARFLARLEEVKTLACDLYNAALQERVQAWKLNEISISYQDQSVQLPEIKKLNSDYASIHSTISQSILKRVEYSFDNFFRRVRQKAEAVGFPRFKSRNRFRSFKFVQSGFRLEGNKLRLSKIGSCRVKISREVIGKIKTCTLIKKLDKWFVILTVERNFELLPKKNSIIGVDAGLEKLLTFSNGEYVENIRHYQKSENKLAEAGRKLSTKKKFSNRWRKQVKAIAKIHQKIANGRKDYLHKLSTAMIKSFGSIAVEDLNIEKLKSLGLGKSISDAAWNMLINFLSYKAARAGRIFKKVEAAYSSQECLCGLRRAKSLCERIHNCDCGIECDRDLMSALIIEHRAYQSPLVDLQASAGTALRQFKFNH